MAEMAKSALEAMTATDAKNHFGALLDSVTEKGRIAITKHDQVSAVVLSRREYEILIANQHDPLRALGEEFEGLVQRMQTPAARSAGKALFGSNPERLGRAAVTRARRRG
jgi:prevent-host-death family protein